MEQLKTQNEEGQKSALVGIIMGSDSDLNIMQAAADILKFFQVPFELTVVSAPKIFIPGLNCSG